MLFDTSRCSCVVAYLFTVLYKHVIVVLYWMDFIARCGLLALFVVVIFGLFEVRYDTLRRRDKDALSVSASATAFFPA